MVIGWVMSIAFLPDGKHVVSGSQDETVRIWDVGTQERVERTTRGYKDSVASVAFSPDGKRLALGSQVATVRIWDVVTQEMVGGPLQGHTG